MASGAFQYETTTVIAASGTARIRHGLNVRGALTRSCLPGKTPQDDYVYDARVNTKGGMINITESDSTCIVITNEQPFAISVNCWVYYRHSLVN